MKAIFGLIGYPLSHSFSQSHFSKKFQNEGLVDYKYLLFELKALDQIRLLTINYPELKGLNVTIPHKVDVIPHLDSIDSMAEEIGAVNCISIDSDKWKGYNTDAPAFQNSLENWLEELKYGKINKALVFGNGGASKAVQWALKDMGIQFQVIERHKDNGNITYEKLRGEDLASADLLINTTPLGMSPNINDRISIDISLVHKEQLLYDLIYNPGETLFLESGKRKGCQVKNGLEMLYLQAEMAWWIWNQSIKHT